MRATVCFSIEHARVRHAPRDTFDINFTCQFPLEYCWLPVPGRRENFTGLLICIIYQYFKQRLFHFTLATLPFCNLTSILKLETIYIFEFQRLDREMNLKGKANHTC